MYDKITYGQFIIIVVLQTLFVNFILICVGCPGIVLSEFLHV